MDVPKSDVSIRYSVLRENRLDQVQIQFRLLHHGLKVDPAFVFLLENDVRRGFIEPDPKSLQLLLDDLFVSERFEDVQYNEDKIGSSGHSNYLPASTFPILGSLNDTRQIKQLDLGPLVLDTAWIGYQLIVWILPLNYFSLPGTVVRVVNS